MSARHQIADAIDLVLHLTRSRGVRVIGELMCVGRYQPSTDHFESDLLFPAKRGEPHSEPSALREVG